MLFFDVALSVITIIAANSVASALKTDRKWSVFIGIVANALYMLIVAKVLR